MSQRWADYQVFWRQFRQTYHSTGAVLPSGRALSLALARYVRESNTDGANGEATAVTGRRILEVGPGTGAVTQQILGAMRPADRLVLVERNDEFVVLLRRRMDGSPDFRQARDRITLLHAAVEDVAEDERFDLIISGLPLNNFTVANVQQIFAKLRRLLAPSGVLSFFEYVAIRRAKSLVSRKADRERLRGISRLFREVLNGNEIRREIVLINVPPAWVHHVRFESLVVSSS